VEDSYVEDGITYEYQSDYDLLVVVKDERKVKPGTGKKIRRKIRKTDACDTPVSLIFHSLDYLNQELEDGSYFFSDIKKEGIAIYNPKEIKLAEAKELSPKQRQGKAQLYFDNWFATASGFLKGVRFYITENELNIAAFNLHQATERFYHTILLVFTDYKPKTHDLEKLGRQVNAIEARFKTVFPRATEEEERLFILLNKAYIDSRYKLGYEIKIEELEYLSSRVEVLKELTGIICPEKIKSFVKPES
jgi:HEPN domain-containing protein